MKYRKKPVVIEAFQMTEQRHFSNEDWPKWLHEAWQKDSSVAGALYINKETLPTRDYYIHTLEGEHYVSLNDFIIQGVQGELYPCKPDIFKATYEAITVKDFDEFYND